MIKLVYLILLIGILIISSPVYAQEIQIRDIDISPSDPEVGDRIKIDVEFEVTDSPNDNRVKLELFIDDILEDVYSDDYNNGIYLYRFEFDTDDLDKSGHKARIKARIYDNGIIEDSDTESETFELDKEDEFVEIDLTGITPDVISTGKITTVHIKLENIGDAEATNIRATLFRKDAGIEVKEDYDTLSKICVDCKATLDFKVKGTSVGENKEMKLRIEYAQQGRKKTKYLYPEIDVKGGVVEKEEEADDSVLSINVYPSKVEPDEFVYIDGYLRGVGESEVIRIYKDGQNIGSTTPATTGYYSAYVKFTNPGVHIVKLESDSGATKTAYITVKSVEEEVKEIIKEVEEKGYVNIDASNTEMDLPLKGSNLLKINIENNLGRDELFGVRTNMQNIEVFVPHSEIIKDGESRLFSIYFGPIEEQGRYEGQVFVTQGDETVREVPVSLYVSGTQEKEAIVGVFKMFVYFVLGVTGLVFLLIFIIINLNRAIIGKESRPLEPRIISTRSSRERTVAEDEEGSYRVPDDNVIY